MHAYTYIYTHSSITLIKHREHKRERNERSSHELHYTDIPFGCEGRIGYDLGMYQLGMYELGVSWVSLSRHVAMSFKVNQSCACRNAHEDKLENMKEEAKE